MWAGGTIAAGEWGVNHAGRTIEAKGEWRGTGSARIARRPGVASNPIGQARRIIGIRRAGTPASHSGYIHRSSAIAPPSHFEERPMSYRTGRACRALMLALLATSAAAGLSRLSAQTPARGATGDHKVTTPFHKPS